MGAYRIIVSGKWDTPHPSVASFIEGGVHAIYIYVASRKRSTSLTVSVASLVELGYVYSIREMGHTSSL